MIKNESQKIQPWITKDWVKTITIYVVNMLVITGLFLVLVYLNSLGDATKSMLDYFADLTSLINFIVFLAIALAIMYIYFYFTDRDFLKKPVNSEMIFLLFEVSLVICFVLGRYVNMYFRPLALLPLLVLFLCGKRTAIFMDVIFCVIILLCDRYSPSAVDFGGFESFIIGISSGVVAVFCVGGSHSRIKLLLRSLLISVPAFISLIVFMVNTGWVGALRSIICCVCSGTLAMALLFVCLPIFEAMFKRVSSFKLAELTDHKSRLIRKLIKEAPGTFNHSIVVSNIAEACAIAIDEDAIFARTCAYYHDIGKLRRTEFFSENQVDGYNPHNDLTPELSTNIIKSHTIDGESLIKKNGLPKEIADVCRQHHGTMPILYFYDKAKKFTDGEVDIAQYCYSGPKPQTKIAAIIMIADGCEAASRTLKDRSRENVKKVVTKIVNERMELGQFDECEITIKELNIIMHTVINNLTGVYHKRVDYPKVRLSGIDLDKKEE